MKTIGDYAEGRDNNFNLIRMLAAIGVLVSHAYPISLGPETPQPLSGLLNGVTLGTVCVMVFFTISGFFITRSFSERMNFADFCRARVLRLFPALAVVIGLTVIYCRIFLSDVPDARYWPAALEYYMRNISLYALKYDLPGVFEQNPYGQAINGSLWTLNYEVTCYLGVVVFGLLGFIKDTYRSCLGLVVFVVLYAATLQFDLHPRLANLMQLGLPFVLGMSFWIWRTLVPLSWALALVLIVAAMLFRASPLFEAALTFALAYTTFVVGLARLAPLKTYNRLGDYSYGTYIYAFPVQQSVAATGVVSPLTNIAIALPITLALAVLSWRLIEKPALSLRHRRISPV